MTGADRVVFDAAYRKLAASLSAKPPAPELIEAAYYDACPFPLVAVEAALESLRTSSRFMPRPVQLIGACQDAARRHASNGGDIPAFVDHQREAFYCQVCRDTGFERGLECNGTGLCQIGRCGREEDDKHNRIPNDPHPFTRRCGCRATNPVLAKERDAMRRPADGDRSAS
jgi:hypothetical protein